jgi:hypothetical protein
MTYMQLTLLLCVLFAGFTGVAQTLYRMHKTYERQSEAFHTVLREIRDELRKQ